MTIKYFLKPNVFLDSVWGFIEEGTTLGEAGKMIILSPCRECGELWGRVLAPKYGVGGGHVRGCSNMASGWWKDICGG